MQWQRVMTETYLEQHHFTFLLLLPKVCHVSGVAINVFLNVKFKLLMVIILYHIAKYIHAVENDVNVIPYPLHMHIGSLLMLSSCCKIYS